MGALQLAIDELVATVATVTGVDRVYDVADASINEPGVVIDVLIEDEEPYYTIDGRTQRYVLNLIVMATNISNEPEAVKLVRAISPRLNAKLRDVKPTLAEWWMLIGNTKYGFFQRNQYPLVGFMKTIELVGQFDT